MRARHMLDLAAKACGRRGKRRSSSESEARERKRTAKPHAWREEEHDREVRVESPSRADVARPQLSLEEALVNASVRSFTVLDYLYRLRIKTNYEDAGMFIDGPEDQLASSRVHRSLVALPDARSSCTSCTSQPLLGVRDSQLADDWLGPNAHGQTLASC